mmetsp:Transcript_84382/g.220368  ORF Transcript_84382/g.220368 Transcript_84382/m.220368 type:complete len:405 (+) Transcript_84382:74-1288(+)
MTAGSPGTQREAVAPRPARRGMQRMASVPRRVQDRQALPRAVPRQYAALEALEGVLDLLVEHARLERYGPTPEGHDDDHEDEQYRLPKRPIHMPLPGVRDPVLADELLSVRHQSDGRRRRHANVLHGHQGVLLLSPVRRERDEPVSGVVGALHPLSLFPRAPAGRRGHDVRDVVRLSIDQRDVHLASGGLQHLRGRELCPVHAPDDILVEEGLAGHPRPVEPRRLDAGHLVHPDDVLLHLITREADAVGHQEVRLVPRELLPDVCKKHGAVALDSGVHLQRHAPKRVLGPPHHDAAVARDPPLAVLVPALRRRDHQGVGQDAQRAPRQHLGVDVLLPRERLWGLLLGQRAHDVGAQLHVVGHQGLGLDAGGDAAHLPHELIGWRPEGDAQLLRGVQRLLVVGGR